LDLPLDFDSLKKAGAMIGSGGLVVMDSNTCMVEVARFFMNYNTLWGGVVGEAGIEGIELSDYKEGARYKDFQRKLKEIKDLG